MYCVYLLYSETTDTFYVGSTGNIKQRLLAHNAQKNISTKHGIPWKLIYFEAYAEKSDALARERRLKHHGKGVAELKKRFSVKRQKGAQGKRLRNTLVSTPDSGITPRKRD